MNIAPPPYSAAARDASQCDPQYRSLWHRIACYCPLWELDAEGDGNLNDLAASREWNPTNQTSSQTAMGRAITGFGSSDRIVGGNVVSTERLMMNDAEGFSLMFVGSTGPKAWANGFPRIIDKSNGSGGQNGWASFMDSANDDWEVQVTGGATSGFDIPTSFWDDVVRVWVMTLDAGGDGLAYIGTEVILAASQTASSWPRPIHNGIQISIGNWNHTSGRAWDGELCAVAVWDRMLADNEVWKLIANPYGMVTPKRRRSYVVPAVGGLSIPVAHRHYMNIGAR